MNKFEIDIDIKKGKLLEQILKDNNLENLITKDKSGDIDFFVTYKSLIEYLKNGHDLKLGENTFIYSDDYDIVDKDDETSFESYLEDSISE